MVTATIEIPAAVYRRAEKAAKARGVSFAAFARAEIERAAPPPRRRPARPGSGERLTLAAMAEARRLAADPRARSYDDIDELFADALR
jgi:hypothetical protein